MVGNSMFSPVIEWDGSKWYLQYDPADSLSVMPDLSGGKIIGASCTEVKIPDSPPEKHYYMAIIDVEIPALMRGSDVRPERYLKGFRVYDYMPPNPQKPDSLHLPEMVFYLKEPAAVSNGHTAQDFLKVVLGDKLASAEKQAEVDRTWSQTLFKADAPQQEASE